MNWRKLSKNFRKEIVRRGRMSKLGRTVIQTTAAIREPVDYYHRRHVAKLYNRQHPSNCMPIQEGYTLLPTGSLPGTAEVVGICRKLFSQKESAIQSMLSNPAKPHHRSHERKGSFLRDLLTDEDLLEFPKLLDFALAHPLLSIITNYLGTIPNLNRIDLVYSIARPTEKEHISSQLFHQDPEGLTQAKVFMNIFDVDKENGPFMFIPASDSERIVAAIRQQRRKQRLPNKSRYQDEEVNEHGGHKALVQLAGPAGTTVVTDTSRCLHAGSRIKPGHFRLLLFLQYCTSHEKAQSFPSERFRSDSVRWLTLRRHSATR